MAALTLKALHSYLKLLENASELKRKMPVSSSQRTMKEDLYEIGALAGIDDAAFKDPQNIAALVGAQRFVMICGEPSISDHVAQVFDGTKVLLTVLIEPGRFGIATSGQTSPTGAQYHYDAAPPLSPGWGQSENESPGAQAQPGPAPETVPDSLTPMISGNTALTCRLFRTLFEHVLGFASQGGAPQGSGLLVHEMIGSREHSRSFLSSALFVLGAEIDRDHLIPFMVEQGLFGMHIFEHLLQNRDYCDAFYAFRRLERAFIGSPTEEESRFRSRMDRFNAQFGGKSHEAKIFEVAEQDKARVDAYLAAADLLEALALTPWCLSLKNAVAAASSNSVRSAKTIARHFERFADGEQTKEQANQEIADHLLAFARQFSADGKPSNERQTLWATSPQKQ